MRALRLALLLILTGALPALAALQFPALTGHVVDDAHLLTPATTASLNESLSDYERGTTNQVVVVTLPSLQGTSIEDFGYQLGRFWGIGQKGKDNGILLMIAPREHKVRIEVGYGLEPVLTDAMCSQIVHDIILPAFRAAHVDQGIRDGAHAILDVLGGKNLPPPHQRMPGDHSQPDHGTGGIALFFIIVLGFWLMMRFGVMNTLAAVSVMSNMRMGSGGFSDGGGSGGGFSGGGGSFGGGGASGEW